MSAPPATPLVLASTSPQRRAILHQLGIPFEVVAPRYREELAEAGDPVDLVRRHAQGKARSVCATREAGEAAGAGERPVLGVDTEVVLDGRVYGKPADASAAEAMLEALAGRTHEVVSGLCLLTSGWTEVAHETTRVTFRPLAASDLARYVAAGEWRKRAGGYAIQGLGASLVERIDGDYLNVVGLPGALLVRFLARRFPGTYGFG